MATYQIFNSITGELVGSATMDDDKLRPMVPEGCALCLLPDPTPEPPAPAQPVTPPAEPPAPAQPAASPAEPAIPPTPDPGATTTHEGT